MGKPDAAWGDFMWMAGFNSGANWEMVPILERLVPNETRRIYPGDHGYQDPMKAFEEVHGRKPMAFGEADAKRK